MKFNTDQGEASITWEVVAQVVESLAVIELIMACTCHINVNLFEHFEQRLGFFPGCVMPIECESAIIATMPMSLYWQYSICQHLLLCADNRLPLYTLCLVYLSGVSEPQSRTEPPTPSSPAWLPTQTVARWPRALAAASPFAHALGATTCRCHASWRRPSAERRRRHAVVPAAPRAARRTARTAASVAAPAEPLRRHPCRTWAGLEPRARGCPPTRPPIISFLPQVGRSGFHSCCPPSKPESRRCLSWPYHVFKYKESTRGHLQGKSATQRSKISLRSPPRGTVTN